MLDELKREANRTLTENYAVTLRSTGAACLDLFATVGALRNAEDDVIIRRFMRAWAEDRDLAVRILFYARDVRGGLGERRVFRTVLGWLADHYPETVIKNIALISEYGRWDDILTLQATPCENAAVSLIRKQLDADLAAEDSKVSLLAKWLPSVNASNPDTVLSAKLLAKALGMSYAEYRRTLTGLRAKIRIIENSLRESDYTFDYGKQSSGAMFKYRKAFLRNDKERYQEFLAKVASGKETMHTGTLTPYDIVHRALTDHRIGSGERKTLDVTWNALEDCTDGRNALCVVDGSGSMYGGGGKKMLPIEAALSLGIYFAEHNKGEFRNHFITFSESPRLVEIKGRDITEKVWYCESYDEIANTNVQKVFELILNTAVHNGIPQEELPETLYFISDMEFDSCTRGAGLTNFEYARQLFESHGYRLPGVVFWNVDSRNEQQPVSMNEKGVMLVSGNSPRVFSTVMQGNLDPYACMMQILGSKRYADITA